MQINKEMKTAGLIPSNAASQPHIPLIFFFYQQMYLVKIDLQLI